MSLYPFEYAIVEVSPGRFEIVQPRDVTIEERFDGLRTKRGKYAGFEYLSVLGGGGLNSGEFKAHIELTINQLAEDANPEHPLTLELIQAGLPEPHYMVHMVRAKKAGLEGLTVEQLRYHSKQP